MQSRPADNVFVPAVTHWWSTKDKNTSGIGKSQGGTRDANLRGDTMDGFRDVIISRLKELEVSEDDIFAGSQFSGLAGIPVLLPGIKKLGRNHC